MYFVVYIYISKFTDIISYYVATNARSMYVCTWYINKMFR